MPQVSEHPGASAGLADSHASFTFKNCSQFTQANVLVLVYFVASSICWSLFRFQKIETGHGALAHTISVRKEVDSLATELFFIFPFYFYVAQASPNASRTGSTFLTLINNITSLPLQPRWGEAIVSQHIFQVSQIYKVSL